MFEYRFATTSLGMVLALVTGCDSEPPTFQDARAATASDAFSARGPNAEARSRGAYDAGAAGSDPISLPPGVSLDPVGVVFCGAAPCQCNNGIDDDGDGTLDGFDVECTGGIDDDESSFATGIPGDNRDPKWQDCFFDGNSGAGDDRCRYPTECLTGEISLNDAACAVTQDCRDNCQPRTPKGCDCFGCCAIELPAERAVNVSLGGSCSAEKLDDPDACPPCTPNPSCAAPPGSDPGDSTPDTGEPPADPAEPPTTCGERAECNELVGCGVGEFCSFGCCLVVIR